MNFKSLLKPTLLTAFGTLLLISCNTDDGVKKADKDGGSSGKSQSFTCKIDNETFTASSYSNTLIGDAYAKRLDIRAQDESGKQIIITINDDEPLGTNFSHLGDTVYVDNFENTPANIKTLGSIVYKNGNMVSSMEEGKEAGYSILTEYNMSENKASGVFEFIIVDIETDDTTHVTDGKFTNMTFTEI